MYILLKDYRIFKVSGGLVCDKTSSYELIADIEKGLKLKKGTVIKVADTIDKLFDCYIKIKRGTNGKGYILKFDHKDLPLLKEQKLKYPESPVYGAIFIEDEGLKFIAKMNKKAEWETL